MKATWLCYLVCGAASLGTAACSANNTNGPGTGTGGTSGNPDDACVASDSDELIADFKTDNGLHPSKDGRSGGFYVYGDTSGGMFDPPAVQGAAYPIDTTTGNTAPTCSGPGSFHVKWSTPASAPASMIWGAAAGTNWVPDVGSDKGTYDATKYKGISFWAKAAGPVAHLQVSFPDVWSDAAANPTALDSTVTKCTYVKGATNYCSPYLVKFGEAKDFPGYAAATIDTTWKRFYVLFADLKQDPNNQGYHRPNMDYADIAHLTGMAIQVNASYDQSGTATANDFNLWIDDVAFIK